MKVDLKRDAIQSAAISSTHSEIGAGLKLLNKRQHRAIVRMMGAGNPYVASHLDDTIR